MYNAAIPTTFKFQSDSINTATALDVGSLVDALNSNLILLILHIEQKMYPIVFSLNSNLILLIRATAYQWQYSTDNFKFQSDSINTTSQNRRTI